MIPAGISRAAGRLARRIGLAPARPSFPPGTVRHWLDNHTAPVSQRGWTPVSDLYDNYRAYVLAVEGKTLTIKAFSHLLRAHGIEGPRLMAIHAGTRDQHYAHCWAVALSADRSAPPPIRPKRIAFALPIAVALAVAAFGADGAQARSLGERIAELPTEQKLAVGVRFVDVGFTIWCVERGKCREVGPMAIPFGGNPKPFEVAGVGLGSILISSAIVSFIQDHDPALARTVSRVNLAVSGAAATVTITVALN